MTNLRVIKWIYILFESVFKWYLYNKLYIDHYCKKALNKYKDQQKRVKHMLTAHSTQRVNVKSKAQAHCSQYSES